MALFGRKKGDADAGDGGESQAFAADPAKAAVFFDRARTVHETGNHEYAMTLWLQGMRLDPASMSALESYFKAAQDFSAQAKKPGPTKDQLRTFSGKSDVDRHLLALLNWGPRPRDASLAVKSVESAVKLKLDEPAYWIAQRAIGAATQEAKPKKDLLVRLKDLMAQIGAFDLAVKAGNAALGLDPSDTQLDVELRNLAAQMAMSKGGYEGTGASGGFRQNIRDAETQRRLEDESRLVKSEDAAVRVLDAARADYDLRPTDTAAIMKYARALLDTGDAANDKAAFELLMRSYEQTREFRFRQQAGDIRLKHLRRRVKKIIHDAREAPGDEAKRQEALDAQRKLREEEINELTLCVEAYPTDLGFKFELGRRHFELGQHEKAIGFFQEAQNDAKNRVRALNYLGQSFIALGWHTEAAESFRQALADHPVQKDETGMELRYGLMLALEAKARRDRDVAAAEEAARLASGIAMQQIGFRDIRERREGLQSLLKELKP